jgi:site-specific recombinase XerD
LSRYSDSYASNQYRALRQFFKWWAEEEELPDPMARLRPPKVTDKLIPVFTSVELPKIERACQGRSFVQRRDAAIIAVFQATGVQLSELAGSALTLTTRSVATSTSGSGRSPSAARTASSGS